MLETLEKKNDEMSWLQSVAVSVLQYAKLQPCGLLLKVITIDRVSLVCTLNDR